MTVVSSERRRFQMHPHLLMDVMRRQAGTLGKAILEGGMNAVDAKAKKFSVELTQKGMVLEDDGQGFPSAEEVQQFFEVFGKPHEESEAKTYGTFRMGRGQIFAFGKNVWRSQCQQMVVDLENMGLDYDLEQLAESERVPGCRITVTFYNPLSPLGTRGDEARAQAPGQVHPGGLPPEWHEVRRRPEDGGVGCGGQRHLPPAEGRRNAAGVQPGRIGTGFPGQSLRYWRRGGQPQAAEGELRAE